MTYAQLVEKLDAIGIS
ncbi:hypothetical protein PL335_06485 [Sulfitobacter faviae]|nr:hypothetical protein [Sulfitobacter faviae]WCE68269.1 hypothetical protein PL335_06485 [Sulfitobacter faviae]